MTDFCLSDEICRPDACDFEKEILFIEDVKEAVKLLKEEFDKKFDEFRKNWYLTTNSELAQLRLDISTLIFGNEGFIEEIDKIFGNKIVDAESKSFQHQRGKQ